MTADVSLAPQNSEYSPYFIIIIITVIIIIIIAVIFAVSKSVSIFILLTVGLSDVCHTQRYEQSL